MEALDEIIVEDADGDRCQADQIAFPGVTVVKCNHVHEGWFSVKEHETDCDKID